MEPDLMKCAATARARRRWLVARALAGALATVSQSGIGVAEPRDCGAVNSGLLDVELSATARKNRRVKLRKGDVLTFAFRAEESVIGFVTLLAGEGSEARLLLGGPDGTSIAHAAKGPGEHDFRFAIVGDGTAAFTVTCTLAATARNLERSSPGRLPSRIEAEYADHLGIVPGAAAIESPIDAGALAASPEGHGSPPSSADARARRGGQIVPPSASAVQWEGVPAPSATANAEKSDEAGAHNLGVKLRLQPAIMVGVLARFDAVPETRLNPSSLSERSWVAGPTAALQLGSSTSLDARLGWGQLDATVIPGTHAADRRVVDARLANTQTFGAWRFAPSVSVNYQQDTQHMSELGPQTTGSGRVDLRPEVAYRIDMDHGLYVEPKAVIGIFWDIGGAPAAGLALPAHPEMRLKAETGVTIGSIDGTKVQLGGSIEEGAPSTPNVWSGRLQVNVPLK